MKFDVEKFEMENTYKFEGEKVVYNEIKENIYKMLDEVYKRCKREENKEIHFYIHELHNNSSLLEFFSFNFKCFIELNRQKLVVHEKPYDDLEMSKNNINIVFVFTSNFYNEINISVEETLYSNFSYLNFDIPIMACVMDVPFKYKSLIITNIKWIFGDWLKDRKIKEWPYL